ncbi:hypothetical protein PF008_g3281 [Phytophthora fragariae]|uniref:Uncharacterized protein n=1 Tax=Phytophthora fragariae TaxID=53985 RepID=A0A6G0SEV2_9STRA|nr:hypothetical protein PF008_g3281 [Phytophthora fragariae]
MDHVKREANGDDGYGQEHVASLTKESEPWRGSSGFGLANILNRSSSGAPTSAMPKFNLPSFHSFGNPLLTKPEVSLAPQHYEEENQYVSTRQQLQQQQQRSADSSPARQASPSPNSRRIAPALVDEEETEQEAENTAATTRSGGASTQSIRGGRWTADEHERFLEGFRIHGHKWKRVQQVVRTRSVTQVRTHAQKYLLKVAKLKAEKKQSSKTAEMTTLAAEQPSTSSAAAAESVDGSNTAPSTPEHGANNESPRKTPRKKVRRLEHGNCDPVDQEYIAAAATTLCFLMSQKIDSLFDTRHEPKLEANNGDFEPYDCYTSQPAGQPDAERNGSRKRSYMHFITEQQDDYTSSYDPVHGEPSSYTIEGSKLCS